jgi:hypothetical protein
MPRLANVAAITAISRAVVAGHDAGIAQEITDRAIAVAGRAFRRIDRVVHRKLAPGEPSQRLADIVEGIGALGVMDQPGACDCAGIDHRIEGMVVGIEADRVEGVAGRLDADRTFHPFGAERIQRQREYERFRHRLDREGDAAIADLIDMAVDGGEADAEMRRIGLAQFRNVVGDVAGVLGDKVLIATLEEPQQRRFGAGPLIGVMDRRGRWQDVHGCPVRARLGAGSILRRIGARWNRCCRLYSRQRKRCVMVLPRNRAFKSRE